jgi:8-amino-7-oxononanoate synthase
MSAGDESWEGALKRSLAGLREASLLRRRRTVVPLDAVHVELDGARLVNFSSNNYLALTHHPRLIEAAQNAARQHGAGSGAAGLISGHGPAHAAAERAVAAWKGTDGAVLLPSGYQANHAAVQTLAALGESRGSGGVRLLLDKLVHASLVDAVRATGAGFRVFPHNHLGKLARLLREADAGQLQVVVTESIFSMDGDAADLAGLAQLKRDHPFFLLLDEAHASGVYGRGGAGAGAGYAAECGLQSAVDASVVTFSKALGCVGGAVCGSIAFCEAVVNFGRAYVYSTSIPPSLAATVVTAIGVLHDEPERQQRVRALAQRLRAALTEAGFDLPPGDSPIVPVIVGEERAALDAADRLREQGMLVVAVRPPTVPRGRSRLRVTLSSGHSDEEVDQLLRALRALRPAG